MLLDKCELNLGRDQRELNPHGTLEFPCAAYEETYHKSAEAVVAWHWHEELEIIYVKTGRLKLRIPGMTLTGVEGDCFFVNSNVLHALVAADDLRIISLVFQPSLVFGQESSVYAQKYMRPLLACRELPVCLVNRELSWGGEFIDSYIKAFMAAAEEPSGYEFVVREGLASCCLTMYREHETLIQTCDVEPDQDTLRLRAMLEYIQEHFYESVGLPQIAAAAGIGERECLRCFKRIMQVSPIQYLIKYRVMRGAAMLLENPGSSISQVAAASGFDSPSNFTQFFRRFYKCTPREYRKQSVSKV